MKKISSLLLVLCIGLVSACSLQLPVDVASGIILASDNVDSMKADLREYSNHQDTIDDLDLLQSNLRHTLKTGKGALFVDSYYNQALIIYAVLKDEIKLRQDELTDQQKFDLIALDNELITLNTSVLALKETAKQSGGVNSLELLNTIYRASVLMSYYKGI